MIDPTGMSATELLGSYARISAELRKRGVVRSASLPLAEYAESLLVEGLGAKVIAYAVDRSYDLVVPEWGRVQAKVRVVSDSPTEADLQTSPFRSWNFDHAALLVLSRSDYRVQAAYMAPVDVLRPFGRRHKYLKGSTVRMTSELFGHAGVIEITEKLQAAADSM